MPTLEHNGIVEMFRENPELAPHLIRLLFHMEVPPHASAAVVESSLDQLLPVEFRADLVLELRDAAGGLVLAVVVEVQRDEDPDKKYSWPVYVTVVRARKRCPTAVLVVATDADVAAWAGVPERLHAVAAGREAHRPARGREPLRQVRRHHPELLLPQPGRIILLQPLDLPRLSPQQGPLRRDAVDMIAWQLQLDHDFLVHACLWPGSTERREEVRGAYYEEAVALHGLELDLRRVLPHRRAAGDQLGLDSEGALGEELLMSHRATQ